MPLKSAGKKPAPQCTVCKVVAILTITFSSDLKIRLRHTLAAVITVLCCSVTGAGAETTEAQRANDLLVQQRALYADAIELIRKGKRQRVTQIRNHYGRHVSGDAFIQELTKYRSKSADRKKHAAVTSLVDMLEAGMIDEEAALQALRNVKG